MPLSTSRLDMKQISPYDKFSLEVDQQPKHTYLTLQHATEVDFYQECLQGKWYIGMIKEADFSNCWFLLDFSIPMVHQYLFSGLKSVTYVGFHSNVFFV